MAVKIRLSGRGRRKLPLFDVVVADSRSPRDGKYIEKIGAYNPLTVPATIEIAEDKAVQWLMNGAQPTETVRQMLSYKGILLKKHLQVGVQKGAITQEQADEKLAAWKQEKESKIQSKRDAVAKKHTETKQSRLQAEAKVREAKAEQIRKKAEVAAASAEQPAEAEAPAAEASAESNS